MNISRLINFLQASKISRFGLEILISFVFLIWLPLPLQILFAVIISATMEYVFSWMLTQRLKKELAGESWSEILNKTGSEI